MKGNEIILYTSSNCLDCKRLKRLFKLNHINFVEKNIDDTEINSDLIMKNIHLLSSPAIEVGGILFIKYG